MKTASINSLLKNDPSRMTALRAVATLDLPDAWLAAGFVRNLVWDALHGYSPTPLNDLDVIFFDPCDSDGARAWRAKADLKSQLPGHQWQVKNQALMHVRNGDRPYRDCEDAMRFWPEIETAVAARIDDAGQVELLAPFGTASLMAGRLTANSKRDRELFLDRLRSKQWLQRWPGLRLTDERVAGYLLQSTSES